MGSSLADFHRVFTLLAVGGVVTGALGLGVKTRPTSSPLQSSTPAPWSRTEVAQLSDSRL